MFLSLFFLFSKLNSKDLQVCKLVKHQDFKLSPKVTLDFAACPPPPEAILFPSQIDFYVTFNFPTIIAEIIEGGSGSILTKEEVSEDDKKRVIPRGNFSTLLDVNLYNTPGMTRTLAAFGCRLPDPTDLGLFMLPFFSTRWIDSWISGAHDQTLTDHLVRNNELVTNPKIPVIPTPFSFYSGKPPNAKTVLRSWLAKPAVKTIGKLYEEAKIAPFNPNTQSFKPLGWSPLLPRTGFFFNSGWIQTSFEATRKAISLAESIAVNGALYFNLSKDRTYKMVYPHLSRRTKEGQPIFEGFHSYNEKKIAHLNKSSKIGKVKQKTQIVSVTERIGCCFAPGNIPQVIAGMLSYTSSCVGF